MDNHSDHRRRQNHREHLVDPDQDSRQPSVGLDETDRDLSELDNEQAEHRIGAAREPPSR